MLMLGLKGFKKNCFPSFSSPKGGRLSIPLASNAREASGSLKFIFRKEGRKEGFMDERKTDMPSLQYILKCLTAELGRQLTRRHWQPLLVHL